MADRIFRLGLYEGLVVLPIQTRTAGVYRVNLGAPAGNSLLSTIYVKSIGFGSSVSVKYYDSGPGDGVDPGELIDLGGHSLLSSSAQSERVIITRISNKPFIEYTVVGSVEFGLHITVVADFPNEAPFLDADAADLTRDKGQPIVVLDDSDGKFYIARGSKGVLSTAQQNFTTGLTRAVATTAWVEYQSLVGAMVEVDVDNAGNRRLWVALNNSGANYTVLAPGDNIEVDLLPASSVWIRSASNTVTYSIWRKDEA